MLAFTSQLPIGKAVKNLNSKIPRQENDDSIENFTSEKSATMSTISTGLNSISTVVFKSVLKLKKTDAKTEIRRQRIFMVILGYTIIGLAYSLSFFPSTVMGKTRKIKFR